MLHKLSKVVIAYDINLHQKVSALDYREADEGKGDLVGPSRKVSKYDVAIFDPHMQECVGE